MKALIGTVVFVLAALLAACGGTGQTATSGADEPLLTVAVSTWGLFLDHDEAPATLARLDARLEEIDDKGGVVLVEVAGPSMRIDGQTDEYTPKERAKTERLARGVAALIKAHELRLVTQAGSMPVSGWASPAGSVDP